MRIRVRGERFRMEKITKKEIVEKNCIHFNELKERAFPPHLTHSLSLVVLPLPPRRTFFFYFFFSSPAYESLIKNIIVTHQQMQMTNCNGKNKKITVIFAIESFKIFIFLLPILPSRGCGVPA